MSNIRDALAELVAAKDAYDKASAELNAKAKAGTWMTFTVPSQETLRYEAAWDAARAALAVGDQLKPVARRWPFVETPGEFTERLAQAYQEFGTLLAAVRYVLIEVPPTLTTPQVPQEGWQPIETAPKDGTEIIGMYTHIETQVVQNMFWIGRDDFGCGDDEEGWWTYLRSEVSRELLNDWRTPTHWMPLPAPPLAPKEPT